jgi:hypothetical protein
MVSHGSPCYCLCRVSPVGPDQVFTKFGYCSFPNQPLGLVWQREFVITIFHLFVNTNLAHGRFANASPPGIYLFANVGMG